MTVVLKQGYIRVVGTALYKSDILVSLVTSSEQVGPNYLTTSDKQCEYNLLDKFSFMKTPRKFNIAKLSIRKLGSSSVLIMRAYGSKALQ